MKPGDHPLQCLCCKSTKVIRNGFKQRRFRAVPVGNMPVYIVLTLPRVGCDDYGAVRQVNISFADPRRSFTRAFEHYVLDLSMVMTIQDVARHLKVGWDRIKDIQKRHLLKHYARPRLKHLRFLAIDEFAIIPSFWMLKSIARALGVFRTGLLAYYDYPISTGPMEDVNNRIKTLKRQAYGFRDLDVFKLKISAVHQAKYALVG